MQENRGKRTVLLLTPEDCDNQALERLLQGDLYHILKATCCEQVRQFIARADVVLCDERFPGGGWRNIKKIMEFVEKPPKLIVCSLTADEGIWADVLQEGVYDLLAKPFDAEEVRRVVGMAVPPLVMRQGSA